MRWPLQKFLKRARYKHVRWFCTGICQGFCIQLDVGCEDLVIVLGTAPARDLAYKVVTALAIAPAKGRATSRQKESELVAVMASGWVSETDNVEICEC